MCVWEGGGSTHDLPRIVELNSEPLLSQAQEWRALPTIDDLESFPELLLFVARLAFAITSDRPQEEQHARLNRTGKLAPVFTAPYNSWRLREPLFERDTKSEPRLLLTAAKAYRHIRNFGACVRALGLRRLPALSADDFYNHHAPLLAQIVYKDDIFTQYIMPAPNVENFLRNDRPHDVHPGDIGLGGDDPGDDEPGGDDIGGDGPGGDGPVGDDPGGDAPGGVDPGGADPAGADPRGDAPEGDA